MRQSPGVELMMDGINSGSPSEELGFFHKKPRSFWVFVILIFIVAGVIRVLYLNTPGMAIDREYHSALIARSYYYQMTDSAADWKKDVALVSQRRAGVIEPPIMEVLASLLYRLVNREHLWFARLLASVYWLVGGIFLFKIVERIESFETALFSTAYYLFVPLGIMISRSFQPDSLMIMMFIISLFIIIWYFERPTLIRFVMAASFSSFTIVIRPFVLFPLIGAYSALAIFRRRSLKRVVDARFFIYIVVVLLPTALFYGYGIFVSGYIKREVGLTILPQLLLSSDYWKGWLLTAADAVGYTPLIAGLVGLPMLRRGMPRALLVGLWAGYAAFCLIFSNHIRFSSYYHLQLVVIVALSFAPIITLVTNRLRQLSNPWYWWLPVIGAVMLITYFNIRDIRRSFATQRKLESREIAQEIGEFVDHSHRVVYLAPGYGTPLEYYAELSGEYWPRRTSDTDRALGRQLELSVEERLAALDFAPEYFVITDIDEFNRHHTDLREFLSDNYHLLAENDNYLIYGVPAE
jgi:hypothetical protein